MQELQLWNIETSEPKLVRKYTGHVNRDGHLRPCFGGTRERSSLVVSPSEGTSQSAGGHLSFRID